MTKLNKSYIVLGNSRCTMPNKWAHSIGFQRFYYCHILRGKLDQTYVEIGENLTEGQQTTRFNQRRLSKKTKNIKRVEIG